MLSMGNQKIEDWLETLPAGDPLTEEEARLSTPYSDLETWARIIQGQLDSGTSRFRGPPGLLEAMENLLSSTTAQEMTSRLLEQTTLTGKIKGG